MTARLATVGVVLAAVALMGGCGRKAELDTPYQAAVDAREAAADEGRALPPEPERPVADRPFILDGLID
jgi:predicted small lipoprotein YifL